MSRYNSSYNSSKIAVSEMAKWKMSLPATVLAVALIGIFYSLEINPISAAASFPEFIKFFFMNFLPPDFSNMSAYVKLIIQTILFSVCGTYVSAILAFVFGLLISDKTNKIAPLRVFVRFIISFLRNVPVLVWAALLVYIFGIGNMVGLIALIFATLGFLSRSYAESISDIAGSKLEALQACGGSYLQVLVHGLIPEFIPSWLNWTLFSFEINIRASVILGMVGAGGIGIMIKTNISLFKYSEAFSLIIILVIMVLCTELVTNKVRSLVQ